MPLLPAFLTRLIDKPCAIRMSSGQVSSCQRAYTRAPPLGLGDTRACFSHRIAKVAPHDPNIHSLRQCHAMLWPRTFVRGNEIFGRTERPAPLVAHGRARYFPAPGKSECPLSPYGRSIAHLPRIFQDIGASGHWGQTDFRTLGPDRFRIFSTTNS